MKNLERIMTRDAITQMLADAGINRETLYVMINEVIDEKIEKITSRVLHDRTGIDEVVKNVVRRELSSQVNAAVRGSLRSTCITITHDKINMGDVAE